MVIKLKWYNLLFFNFLFNSNFNKYVDEVLEIKEIIVLFYYVMKDIPVINNNKRSKQYVRTDLS